MQAKDFTRSGSYMKKSMRWKSREFYSSMVVPTHSLVIHFFEYVLHFHERRSSHIRTPTNTSNNIKCNMYQSMIDIIIWPKDMKILTLYKYYNHHIQSIRGENHVHILLIKKKYYSLQTNSLRKLHLISFPKLHNQYDIISLLFLFLPFSHERLSIYRMKEMRWWINLRHSK